jgi:dienelactone hydrolase
VNTLSWIESNFTRTVGPDFLFPDVMGFRLERGYKYADVIRTNARIRIPAMSTKQWEITASQQEELALSAEKQGHTVTASAFFFRAAIYYGRAGWSILSVTERKRDLQRRCRENFTAYVERTQHRVRQIQFDTPSGTVFGILHLPSGEGPWPVGIHFPGTDMFKEEYPNPFENLYTDRGIAMLSIDGPGQGETLVEGLTLTAERYDEAGSAAIDFLVEHPEIDSERIFTTGSSFGSHWSLRVAAHDARVRVASGFMGVVYDLPKMLLSAPPAFTSRLQLMTGCSGNEFASVAAGLTLRGRASDVNVPVLLTTGEFDELCPLTDAEVLFEELACPKELWIAEDEAHPLGGVAADLLPAVIDWSVENLTKPIPNGHSIRRIVPAR